MGKASPLAFDADVFLSSAGPGRKLVDYPAKAIIFAQGNPSQHVMYIQKGSVKLSVVNGAGKAAIVAIRGPGDFLGEGCLAGQKIYIGSAVAIMPATLLVMEKRVIERALHRERAFSDRFIKYMLSSQIRVQGDLIDQLFNSAEKRLARALLLLAHFGTNDPPKKVPLAISQETLAEVIGSTRPRVSCFMTKFRKLGYVDTRDGLRINGSLLSVVLRD